MPAAHRDKDNRICTAKTTVQNQSSVYVNDELWAVEDSECDHVEGGLIPTHGRTVFIEDKPVIVKGDHAKPNSRRTGTHTDPIAEDGSPNVFAYSEL